MQSWFKVNRSIFSNEIITHDPEYFSVYIYLLSCSVYNPHQVIFDGKPLMLQKGQLITSRKRISNETKVGESKVQRILVMFEKAQLIEQQTNRQNRLITLLETESVEEIEQETVQRPNSERTTDELRSNTYKKEKKEKNERRNNFTHAHEKQNFSESSYDLNAYFRQGLEKVHNGYKQ